MRTTFRTRLSIAAIVKLLLGAALLLAGGLMLLTLLWALLSAATGRAEGDVMICFALSAVGFAAVAWYGWLTLPPLRTHLLAFDPEGLTIRGYGPELTIPWADAARLRIDQQPVRQRLRGNGPAETWHLTVVPRDRGPVAVPLDTFGNGVDEIVAAFQSTAPDTVVLELAEELEHLADGVGHLGEEPLGTS